MAYELTDKDKEWIQYLKDNPDKKYIGELGSIKNNDLEKACCLGARHWIEINDPDTIFSDGSIRLTETVERLHHITKQPFNKLEECFGTLIGVYKPYNLRNAHGFLLNPVVKDGTSFRSLIDMNDSRKWTWPEIAEYIENNPDNVFVNWSNEQ